jgi:hypothetical protein
MRDWLDPYTAGELRDRREHARVIRCQWQHRLEELTARAAATRAASVVAIAAARSILAETHVLTDHIR